ERPDGEGGRVPVPLDRLGDVAAAIAERYPKAWSKEAVRDTGRLVRSVAQTLVPAGLARLVPAADGLPESVEISPAAARDRPRPDGPDEEDGEHAAEPAAPSPGEGHESLFGP